ncbi:DUF4339 domain-containing protein [Candidatus Protochlamydia phocaeensis]|uniref:DUF4339 domain-containing protein n=1 Tax=Candidatus Protochlamydia phocaeensis TaxID=1414722 RepID=UPI000837FF1E|nr:DUF4339 domain-containing protein [Candidatus Protochlamydia phocaeensis]
MSREWYILIQNERAGPYSIQELKIDERITPDTLVWKEGWKDWLAMRFVPELKEVFEDKPESKPIYEDIKPKPLSADLMQEQEALTLQQDPYQLFLWILLFILILIYLFYQFNK